GLRGTGAPFLWMPTTGGVERTQERLMFAEIVHQCDRETLLDVISNPVAAGSTVHTNLWCGWIFFTLSPLFLGWSEGLVWNILINHVTYHSIVPCSGHVGPTTPRLPLACAAPSGLAIYRSPGPRL